jgi:dienelactone hydrolase
VTDLGLSFGDAPARIGLMQHSLLEYQDGKTPCEAYVAHTEGKASLRPCVLLLHAWHGIGPSEHQLADKLAAFGYVSIALDLYGKGVRGNPTGDNGDLMRPFVADRALLRRRIDAGLKAAQNHPLVDPERIAAVGHCFGGMAALDLARSGAPGVRGVVSIHGLLHAPQIGSQVPITAKVLVLHGYRDRHVPPAEILSIAAELTSAEADWELQIYGRAQHGFTSVGRNAPHDGIVYDARADRQSWGATVNFLEEVLAG